jgi:hypothetical protein
MELKRLMSSETAPDFSGRMSNASRLARILDALAKDRAVSVRCNVAANPSAPRNTLAVLAKDSEESVRNNVAANPSTPAIALEESEIH